MAALGRPAPRPADAGDKRIVPHVSRRDLTEQSWRDSPRQAAGSSRMAGRDRSGIAASPLAGLPGFLVIATITIIYHQTCGMRVRGDGGLAQLVEHLLCKQGVNGSSPLSSTRYEVIDMLGTRRVKKRRNLF